MSLYLIAEIKALVGKIKVLVTQMKSMVNELKLYILKLMDMYAPKCKPVVTQSLPISVDQNVNTLSQKYILLVTNI